MWLTIALLILVTVVAVLGITSVVRNRPIGDQYVAWAGCGMLVCLAIAVLLLGHLMTQRALAHVEQQLRALARDEQMPGTVEVPVPDDLKPVMTALSGYIGRVRDRMDRLRLQQKELDIQMRVAEAERRHTEAIIYSISDAVLVVDPFGELVLANSAAERLFNFRLGDCRQRPLERVIDDQTLVALIKDARTVDGRSERRQVEYSAVRAGKTQTFIITLSTVLEGQDQARGVVAVFHDITREREIAQVKTDFVSAVSHELRTPLSSIKAYTEMLVDGEAHDEQTRREFYQIIQAETDRLQRLVSNVLNISRIEAGVVDIHRQSVSANEVIEGVLSMMAVQANEKNIALCFEPAKACPNVWADRDLLHQAIMNLVSNSLKYTGQGGRVEIKTAVDGPAQRLVITVSDNGMGIRGQDLPRIFDKFYRTPDGAAVANGTGLGLNLVKHIIETVHGGEIAVSSEHGVGTTFTVRLPLMMN